MSSLSEFIELYELSTHQRAVALERMLAVARARDLPELVEHIDDCLDAALATRELEQEWEESRSRKSGLRAVEIDRRIDGLLARLYAVLEGFAGLDDAASHEATDFQAVLYPSGLSGHVHRPHGEQLHENDRVVNTLGNAEYAVVVERYRLGPFGDRLRTLNEQFRDVLEEAAEETVSFAAVRTSRDRNQEVLLQIVARVLGAFPTQSPEHIAARDALLGPVRHQERDARQGWSTTFTSFAAVDPEDAAALGEE